MLTESKLPVSALNEPNWQTALLQRFKYRPTCSFMQSETHSALAGHLVGFDGCWKWAVSSDLAARNIQRLKLLNHYVHCYDMLL